MLTICLFQVTDRPEKSSNSKTVAGQVVFITDEDLSQPQAGTSAITNQAEVSTSHYNREEDEDLTSVHE